MNTKTFEMEQEGIRVMAELVRIGKDILVILSGGDVPHIGAIAGGSESFDLQTITFPDHKEDVVVNQMADAIRKVAKGNVCIIGGIHVDNISNNQIMLVVEMCKVLTERVIDNL